MSVLRPAAWIERLASLRHDRRGGVMVVFSFAIVPLILAGGLAIDGLMAVVARAEMSRAVDAAALAAAGTAVGDRDAVARRLFAMNFPQGRFGIEAQPLQVSVDPDAGTVQVSASGDMPTHLLRLIDRGSIRIGATATAESGAGRQGLELALVLDVTNSMNETDRSDPARRSKIAALKGAAAKLIDLVYQDKEEDPDLRVSVVPFAGRVNTQAASGPRDRGWMAGAVPRNWSGCLDVRYGAHAYTDATPETQRFAPLRSSADWVCPRSAVLPLTAAKSRVRASIDGLVADGNTRTDIGLAWGWRTLSPKWRGLWDGAAGAELPLDYHTPDMVKAVVLMTDGMNTPEIIRDPEDKGQSEANLLRTCQAMKAEGIVIYTVLFQTPAELRPLYEECASSRETFLVAASNQALETAFGTIGVHLRSKYVRLTR